LKIHPRFPFFLAPNLSGQKRIVAMTRLSKTFLSLSILIPVIVLGQVASAGPPTGQLAVFGKSRQWSDKAGKFKIEASLTDATKTEVKIKKADGRVVTVPFAKLSEADQKFVEVFLEAEASMGGSENENPFEGGEPATPSGDVPNSTETKTESGSKSSTLDELPMVKFNDTRATPVKVDFTKPFWKAGPVMAMKLPESEEQVVQVPMSKDFFDKIQIMVAGGTPTAFVNIYRQGRSPEENYSRIGALKFPDGDPEPLGQSSKPWKLMTVSLDAKKFALVRDEGWDKGNDVAIVSVDGASVTPEFQFTAGGGAWDELHWGAFLPNDRFITISQKQTLTVWDLKGRKALFRGTTGESVRLVVGGRGELIAIPARGKMAFLNGETLKQVGMIALERNSLPSIAFSGDGQFVAAYVPFSVSIYSLKDGSLVKSIAVGNSVENLPLAWVGPNVLLENKLLVDVERGIPLWTYGGPSPVRAAWGSNLYTIFADNTSSIVSLALPHPAAERAAEGIDREKLFAIKKGSSVAVSANLEGMPYDQQEAARAAVERNLTQLGWKVISSATNQVQLTLRRGERQEADYGTTNSPFPTPFGGVSGPITKVSYQPWHHIIVVTANGEEVFRTEQMVSNPGYLQLKEGESIQQAVDRHVQPSVQFFETVTLPAEIIRPQYREGLGKSEIMGNGLK
jgi:SLA1 homology domain 1, SHD1